MAYIKYTGEEALGRVAEYVNKKLAFASTMPSSLDTNTIDSDLTNKPSLNGVSLAEGQTTEDLGLVNDVTTYMESDGSIAIGMVSNDQINNLFN